jgi:phosphohistidine phosphatase
LRLKQLLIIRHAKSNWALAGQDDFDRPLNERGMRDGPMMAQRLLDKEVAIDAFITSPANRAITTANYFAEKYQLGKGKMRTVRQLYQAQPKVFYETIASIEDTVTTAAIFSHNPGITAFINELTPTKIDDMPTCGVFAIKIETDSWKDFWLSKKTFWFFDYPKQ